MFVYPLQFCDFSSEPQLVCDAIGNLEAMEESYDLLGMWIASEKWKDKTVLLTHNLLFSIP